MSLDSNNQLPLQIYVKFNGVTQGPFQIEQLRQMLRNGELSLDEPVFIDGQSQWISLSEVPNIHRRDASFINKTNSGGKNNGWLWLGIIFMPYIFSWFTLKSGYDTLTRIIAFIWLGLVVIGIIVNPPKVGNSRNSIAQKESSSRETTKQTLEDIRSYRSLISSIDEDGNVIASVSQGRMDGEVKITVSNAWHYQPYQVRLQTAQNLWNAWSRVHSPNDPDKSRIQIVDLNDNKVGGSRVLAGSLIWVQE
jgi:hypothetical protein